MAVRNSSEERPGRIRSAERPHALSLSPAERPQPLKFSFEVVVRSLELRPHIQCDRVHVLWTRGSKAAHTREVALVDGCALVDEKLCLLCTLVRDDERLNRKLCSFTIVQRSGLRLGRASVDLSRHASLEPSGARSHTVDVLRGKAVVGSLSLDISSRWLRDYLRQAGAAADDASSPCSDSSSAEGLSDGDESELSYHEDDSPASGSATAPASRRGAGGTHATPLSSALRRERSTASDVSPAARADQSLQAQLADERATRRELEAELAAQAAVSLRRQASARPREPADERLRAECQALREQLAEADAQHAGAEERWRLELQAARREKESALAEVRELAAEREAALEGRLASVQEVYGERLARAEEQKQTVSRRLGKASKSSESALAQLHAENSLLGARADALETELCEALDARRRQTEQAAALTRRVGELEQLLSGAEEGADGASGGAEAVEELREQLSVARSVRDALRADIVQLERELVSAKLASAQDEDENAQLRRQLRASKARQLAFAERMTELEVRLSEAFDEGSLAEERIAEAFSSVIRELESQLEARKHPAPARVLSE